MNPTRWLPVFLALIVGVSAPAAALAGPLPHPDDQAFLQAFAPDGCDSCKVLNRARACYPHLGLCVSKAKVLDPGSGAGAEVVLDDLGQALELDTPALAALEARPRVLVHGPIHPDLSGAIAASPAGARLPVVVWLKTYETDIPREDLLADPAFLAETGAAQDKALDTVRSSFAALIAKQAGLGPFFFTGAPAVFVTATPGEVLWLSTLEPVAAIYLWTEPTPQADSWYETDNANCAYCNRAPGVKACIIHPHRPDDTSTLTIQDYYVDPPSGSTEQEVRFSTGVLRSTATVGGGAAAQASIFMGNWQTPGVYNSGPVMAWCASLGVRVWSFSYLGLDPLDRLFDYWTKHNPYPLIAAPAGNSSTGEVTSNRAFNILCVGGSNDQGDSDRSNDTIYGSSRSTNPSSPHNDRELPVLVAPAVNVSAANLNVTGTSASVPQVAAAAAQIQYVNSAIAPWPEVQRAILMVGSDENVDGPVLDLSDGTDDRDGAGAVNFALATTLAQAGNKKNGGNDPAQAGFDYGTMNFTSDFTNGYYNEVYQARFPFSGMRLRVVLAWDSSASCSDSSDPLSCTSDTLDGDLDLEVYMNGYFYDASTSWDNSYEFVEIPMAANTTYQIKIRRASYTNPSTYFGIAWFTWNYGS